MRRVRACVAIAAWISVTLSISACSMFEIGTPPPESALPPAPPPPEPYVEPEPEPLPAGSEASGRVRAEMVRWFSAAKYRDFQIEALVDHARIESGLQPCAGGPGGFRYLFQWGGERLQRLHEFARTRSCPPLDTQLAFADNELRNEPSYSCFWRAATRSAALATLRRGFGGGSC
jgi:hypothetical protein